MDIIKYSIPEEKIENIDIKYKLIDLEINNDGIFTNLEEYILSFIGFIKECNFRKNKYPIKLDNDIKNDLNNDVISFLEIEIDENNLHETINKKKNWIGFQYKDCKWFLQKKPGSNNIFRSVLCKLQGNIGNNGYIIINENLKIIDDEAYEVFIDDVLWDKLIKRLTVISLIQRYIYKHFGDPKKIDNFNIDANKL